MYEIRCIPPACRSSPALPGRLRPGSAAGASPRWDRRCCRTFRPVSKTALRRTWRPWPRACWTRKTWNFRALSPRWSRPAHGLWQRDDPGLFPGGDVCACHQHHSLCGLPLPAGGADQRAGLRTDPPRRRGPPVDICTEADETVVQQEGDIVFFLMCPQSMEE